jgi:hypothetical protein
MEMGLCKLASTLSFTIIIIIYGILTYTYTLVTLHTHIALLNRFWGYNWIHMPHAVNVGRYIH